MHFTPQLLIGLLVEASILDIDSDDTRHNLDKVDFIARKLARLRRLHTDHTYQALGVAEENDGQGNDAV